MPEKKSMLESMARNLNRAAVLLLVLFVGAAIGAVHYVDDEIQGDPDLFRYLLTIATVSPLLVGAVIAWVGSTVVRALGRVRGSILDVLIPEHEPQGELDPAADLTRIDR